MGFPIMLIGTTILVIVVILGNLKLDFIISDRLEQFSYGLVFIGAILVLMEFLIN